jgi:hypothetical protein
MKPLAAAFALAVLGGPAGAAPPIDMSSVSALAGFISSRPPHSASAQGAYSYCVTVVSQFAASPGCGSLVTIGDSGLEARNATQRIRIGGPILVGRTSPNARVCAAIGTIGADCHRR